MIKIMLCVLHEGRIPHMRVNDEMINIDFLLNTARLLFVDKTKSDWVSTEVTTSYIKNIRNKHFSGENLIYFLANNAIDF